MMLTRVSGGMDVQHKTTPRSGAEKSIGLGLAGWAASEALFRSMSMPMAMAIMNEVPKMDEFLWHRSIRTHRYGRRAVQIIGSVQPCYFVDVDCGLSTVCGLWTSQGRRVGRCSARDHVEIRNSKKDKPMKIKKIRGLEMH